MTIFRDEPPPTEEDTKPVNAYPKPPLNTRGLDLEFLYNPSLGIYRALIKGAFSAYLKKRGWKAVTQKEYEVCKRN